MKRTETMTIHYEFTMEEFLGRALQGLDFKVPEISAVRFSIKSNPGTPLLRQRHIDDVLNVDGKFVVTVQKGDHDADFG